jgi:hypothetical protein
MQARVRLPKAFSVRDAHEFFPFQHLAERLNPHFAVIQIARGFHVRGDYPVYWGLVYWRGCPLSQREIDAALREAGFDFHRNGPVESAAAGGSGAGHPRRMAAEFTRLSESTLLEAITHADATIRATALQYFVGGHSGDERVMLAVIAAVEGYGRDQGVVLLEDAETLVQTPATVEWLIAQLRENVDHRRAAQNRFAQACASALVAADPPLLATREEEMAALPGLPAALRTPLHQRLQMAAWNGPQCWEALQQLGWDTMLRNQVTPDERRYAGRVVEALARHREQAPALLAMLRRPYRGKDRALVRWLEPEVVAAAGHMRLEAAIPALVRRVRRGNVRIIDEAFDALERIGSPAVVAAIERIWWEAKSELRASLAGVLEDIRDDTSAQACMTFLALEDDPDVQVVLANALLGNFVREALDMVARLLGEVDRAEWLPDQYDLAERLAVVAAMMGETSGAYEHWRQNGGS